MRISDMFSEAPIFSFEFFPPRTAQGEELLLATLADLRPLRPNFVSVTYGAGGSTRQKTVELVVRIRREFRIEAMAHLTCVGHSREELAAVLDRLQEEGIENVLALRGDPPRGETQFRPAPGGFRYAAELVAFIRRSGYRFCLGGAGYPEGHVEAPDFETDLRHLKEKVDAGLDFVITQLFFDNRDYFRFVRRAHEIGIRVPILPGIMPVTNVAQIERFTVLCGARIPEELQQRLDAVREDPEAVVEVGIDHATRQCRELLAAGAPGIHFYTLNRSPATRAILSRLRS